MFGYISGVNDSGEYKLGKSKPDAFMRFMDDYCQDNPLDAFYVGVQALVYELRMSEIMTQ
jgi:hypothetical protein